MMNFDEYIKYVQDQAAKIDDIIINEMLENSIECVAEIKARTPFKTGALRRSITTGELEKNNGQYSIDIGSSLKYAQAVEEGHRQEVGKYIPALGKKLKQPFVNGYHMINDGITIQQEKLENNIAARIENEVFK